MLVMDVRAPSDTKSVGTYFDSCVFLIMFILLGRTLEAFAKSKTTDAVSLLGSLRPETALLVDTQTKDINNASIGSTSSSPDGSFSPVIESPRPIPVNRLERGDLLIVQPGSVPPTDGVIISGSTTFDESSLTGESRPVSKGPDDEVFTGTINSTSAIMIRVTRLASDNMLERIIAAVNDASARKAPIEKLAERLTGVFVPIIVYLALFVLAVWLGVTSKGVVPNDDFADPGGRVFFAIEFAISTLVVACPCGIGLAVPCANAVGNGIAARAGILAAGGGQAFLAATKIKTIALDKTGTLTIGKSVVTDEVYLEGPVVRPILLQAVRHVEAQSTHPLAVGLVEHLSCAESSTREGVEVTKSDEIGGRGVRACIAVGKGAFDILIGNVALMSEHGIALNPQHQDTVNRWSNEAKSVVLVASRSQWNEEYILAAMYSLSDPPRETTPAVLAGLRAQGYRLMMLSGDNERTAQAVGIMVGIKEADIRAGVGPEGKAEILRELQAAQEAPDIPKKRTWWRSWMSRPGKEAVQSVMFVGGESILSWIEGFADGRFRRLERLRRSCSRGRIRRNGSRLPSHPRVCRYVPRLSTRT